MADRMNISTISLTGQYKLLESDIRNLMEQSERVYGLPPFLLAAIASRETNMQNIMGDGGFGVGMFQRDKRAWNLSDTDAADLLADMPRQISLAATLLAANYKRLGDWKAACAAYNAGVGAVRWRTALGLDPDGATTGRNYGADVMERQSVLQSTFQKKVKVVHPIVRIGSMGEAVKTVQKAVGAKVDGIFGNQTKQKVIAFQRRYGLVQDGVVGSITWKVIDGLS